MGKTANDASGYRRYLKDFQIIEMKALASWQGGQPLREVRDELIADGFDKALVDKTLRRLWEDARDAAQAQKQRAQHEGLAWFLGGLTLTIVTFLIAPPGGAFLVATGPMIYGVSRLLQPGGTPETSRIGQQEPEQPVLKGGVARAPRQLW